MRLFAPQNILCAVDLSPASHAVLGWAALFARNFNAKLEVLHAEWADYPSYFFLSQENELANRAEERRAAIEKALADVVRASPAAAVSPEVTVIEGHAVEVILKHAEAHRPDLIVMGSHGRSGIARMRLGSVSEAVMHETGAPILIVRSLADAQPPKKISRILCPVSFAKGVPQCHIASAGIASTFGAELLVMHAVENQSANLETLRKQLCASVPASVRQSCKVIEVLRHGAPAEQMLLAAREYGADLIVIAARHHPFMEFTTLGTTVERVVRHSDSAVLLLPKDI